MKLFFRQVLATIVGIFLFTLILFFLISSLVKVATNPPEKPNDSLGNKKILVISLDAPVMESELENPTSLTNLSTKPYLYLNDIIDRINRASEDSEIQGISLELNMPDAGMSQLKNIREALKKFKKSGKFIYAYQENISQKAYYINSVADFIFQDPMGMIEFKGLATEVVFYKNLAHKLGVNFDVVKAGKYKGAIEPFTRENLSDENRMQIQAYLDDIWADMLHDISQSRNIPIDSLNKIADNLSGAIPKMAFEKNLIDKIATKNDYLAFLSSKLRLPSTEDIPTITLEEMNMKRDFHFTQDEIAVLHINGNILPGNGYEGVQAETFEKAIEEIKDRKEIKAVVLRVNSPGGSASVADKIYESLLLLKKTKPIYASFGDTAASGGYYIAMAADSIYASPESLIGSIGVFGILPNISSLAKEYGVTTEIVQTNDNGMPYSVLTGLTGRGKEILELNIDETYHRFLSIVAKNRRKSLSQIEALAGGRIYSGRDAKDVDLIDGYASVSQVIKKIATNNEIKRYAIHNYPKVEKNLLSTLDNTVKINLLSQFTPVEIYSNPLLIYLQQLSQPVNQIQMINPFLIKIY